MRMMQVPHTMSVSTSMNGLERRNRYLKPKKRKSDVVSQKFLINIAFDLNQKSNLIFILVSLKLESVKLIQL